MDILNSIRPAGGPAIPAGLAASDLRMIDDLDSQQRHREVLLREAEKGVELAHQAGCVSEISIVESAFDSDEYQAVIQEISQFLQNLHAVGYVGDNMKLRIEAKIESYDDSSLPVATGFEALSEIARASEADVEELGYMGWLGLA